ncbi:MAG: glycosyltransferase [Fuerstiella sp.]
MTPGERVGVVVIGRNEGERLKRCLHSIAADCDAVVYVDSGSTDGSVEFARSLSVDVVDLDMSRPFTMARGRNTGFQQLLERFPTIELVQFVDGDCEVAAGWIEAAVDFLDRETDVVAVCGRRREQRPEASIFNKLCDVEWDAPPGYSRSCGGDAMFRAAALASAGGFNESMIAGEEGELCFRLRAAGGKILRVSNEMTRHDAAMTKWSQWLKRNVRGGHAFAEGAWLHGNSDEKYNIKQTRSALFWGCLTPLITVACVVLALLVSPWIWLAVALSIAAYLMLSFRVYSDSRRRGRDLQLSVMRAACCVIGKLPEAMGVLKFQANRLLGKRSELIEYK